MAPTAEHIAQRDQAAARTRARIRADKKKSDGIVADLLDYLEDHLFDTDLNVSTWFAACGARSGSGSLARKFADQLKSRPLEYFHALRSQTGRVLLEESDLDVWQITELLGYERMDTFRDAFRRATGRTPTAYAKEVGNPRAGRKKKQAPGFAEQCAKAVPWRRTLVADTPEREGLESKLLEDYPFLRYCRVPSRRYQCDARLAENVVRTIEPRDFDGRRLTVRSQLAFGSLALFDRLRQVSLEKGRLVRADGVEWARLALESLEAVAHVLGDDLPNREAEGWICLGNALRLADEHELAEYAYDQAQHHLGLAGDQCDTLVKALLDRYRANLRWLQHRYDPALRLVGRSIAVLEQHADPTALAQALILRGGIHLYARDPDRALSDFCDAMELISEQDQPYLVLSAQSNLAVAYWQVGKRQQAEQALAKSYSLCDKNVTALNQLRWSEAVMRQEEHRFSDARTLLEKAVDGFEKAGEVGYEAVARLDLALHHLEVGDPEDAAQAAGAALPVLRALRLLDEQIAAVQVLREALEAETLTLALVGKVRDLVARSQARLSPPRARERKDPPK